MISPLALVLALAVAAPSLWATLYEHSLPVDVALRRMLLILVATSLGWSLVQQLLAGFARSAARGTAGAAENGSDRTPARRRDDRTVALADDQR